MDPYVYVFHCCYRTRLVFFLLLPKPIHLIFLCDFQYRDEYHQLLVFAQDSFDPSWSKRGEERRVL